jgi:hypothetical protein
MQGDVHNQAKAARNAKVGGRCDVAAVDRNLNRPNPMSASLRPVTSQLGATLG